MTLTPKQQLFVAEYPNDLNATRAAIRAGYSENGADVTGVRLLGNPRIQQAMAENLQRIVDVAGVTAADIVREAWSIATDTERHDGARVSALALLAKRHPEFSDKHDHAGPGGGPIPLLTAIANTACSLPSGAPTEHRASMIVVVVIASLTVHGLFEPSNVGVPTEASSARTGGYQLPTIWSSTPPAAEGCTKTWPVTGWPSPGSPIRRTPLERKSATVAPASSTRMATR